MLPLAAGFYHDPIKALIDFGDSRDIDTVIVDGRRLVEGGGSIRLDEMAVYAQAKAAVHRAWDGIPHWHGGEYDLNRLVPPAFTAHRQPAMLGKPPTPARMPYHGPALLARSCASRKRDGGGQCLTITVLS